MRLTTTISSFFIAFLLSASSLLGQTTWEYFFYGDFPPFSVSQYLGVAESSSGEFTAIGRYSASGLGADSTLISRLDAQGNLIWEKKYYAPSSGGNLLTLSQNEIYLLEDFFSGAGPYQVFHLDSNGNHVDTLTSSTNALFTGHSFFMNANNQIVVSGATTSATGGKAFFEIMDTNGVAILDTSYTLPYPMAKATSMQTSDGNYLMATQVDRLQFPGTGYFLHKITANGTILWSNNYLPGLDIYDISQPKEGLNGQVFVANTSSAANEYELMSTDSLGDSLWSIFQLSTNRTGHIDTRADGSVTIGTNNPGIQANIYLAEFDSSGGLLWDKRVPNDYNVYSYAGGILAPETGGVLVVGNGQYSAWVTRLDSTGNLLRNHVSGSVFHDLNANCLLDPNESRFPYWLVRALPGNQIAMTGPNGEYEMQLDSGNYTLELIQPVGGAWNTVCPPPMGQIPLNFTGWTDTIVNANFGLEANGSCAALRVEMATNFLRACNPSTHGINYFNLGNQVANNAYVEIDLDTLLTFASSTIPATALGNNRYRFDLPSIPIGGTGSFQVNAAVSCKALLGESACSEARIYPNTSCNAPNPNWSGASIEVEGACIPGDTIEFTLRNNSNNAMLAPVPIWVAEDDILKLQSTVQLGALQTTSFKFAGTGGGSWTCIADQVDFHPGNSLPRAFVEACGRNLSGGFSTGFVATVMQDELDYFRSIDCKEVVGSFDPNDKTGFPVGLGITHDILATDELDYLIRFQNTGTDTAFKIVITDVLPEQLDPSTLQVGTSSHPYTLNVLPGNELEWTFDPIELPDSNVNEPQSHGFVTFRIDLDSGLTPSTQIRNNVNIYFDYNLPVLTNTTLHTVREAWVDLLVVSIEAETGEPKLKVYPNPSARWIRFEPEVPVPGQLLLEVFDLQGRMVQTTQSNSGELLELDGSRLEKGVYIFRLKDGNGHSFTGKFILK